MKNKLLFWNKIFATVGGVGLLPLAPGTWGAAVGILFLIPFIGKSGSELFLPLLFLSGMLTWIGAIVAKRLEPYWGEDPKQYVMDEFVGVWIAILGHTINWQYLLASFVLFRIFDIWKPLGIRRLEKIENGWGVMLDDVAAGIAANIFLFGFEYLRIIFKTLNH